MSMSFDDAVKAYRELIEQNTEAIALLTVDVADKPGGYVVAVSINEDMRPEHYIRLVAEKIREAGEEIEQMIFQAESWIRIMDLEGEETGLDECATLMMRNRSGEERSVVIPFTRLGDGTVNWREPEEIPMDSNADGTLIEALREVLA